VGDELRIRPKAKSLKDIGKKFAKFSKNFSVEGRGEEREGERDSL
jgi:hypothetical protein